MTKWDKLVSKLEGRRATLMGLRNLVGVFRDMESAHSDLTDIEVRIACLLIYSVQKKFFSHIQAWRSQRQKIYPQF